MTKIYAIEERYYNNHNITTYETYASWVEAIDIRSNESDTQGRDLSASVYEIEEGQEWRIERKYYGRDYHDHFLVTTEEVDEDGDIIREETYPDPISAVGVEYWSVEEVWAEKDNNGHLTLLAPATDEKPEPEDGGEVIIAYSDGVELSLTEEEASVPPSMYQDFE